MISVRGKRTLIKTCHHWHSKRCNASENNPYRLRLLNTNDPSTVGGSNGFSNGNLIASPKKEGEPSSAKAVRLPNPAKFARHMSLGFFFCLPRSGHEVNTVRGCRGSVAPPVLERAPAFRGAKATIFASRVANRSDESSGGHFGARQASPGRLGARYGPGGSRDRRSWTATEQKVDDVVRTEEIEDAGLPRGDAILTSKTRGRIDAKGRYLEDATPDDETRTCLVLGAGSGKLSMRRTDSLPRAKQPREKPIKRRLTLVHVFRVFILEVVCIWNPQTPRVSGKIPRVFGQPRPVHRYSLTRHLVTNCCAILGRSGELRQFDGASRFIEDRFSTFATRDAIFFLFFFRRPTFHIFVFGG